MAIINSYSKDKIKIDRIKIFAHHGVLASEKEQGQYFYVSIQLDVNLKRVGASDNIADTVNYAEVTELAEKIFTDSTYDTIEAAADGITIAILSNYDKVKSVTVKVSKPDAPIDADFEDVSVELIRSRHRVYLGLGSNLGDRENYLDTAIDELSKDSAITVGKVSTYIETEPYGPVDQPDFMNGVIEIETFLEPDELLDIIHDIEAEAGRERKIHWGPRTLDIDILLFDDIIMNTETLTIPHPEMHKREFVLKPLVEIASNVIHPVYMKTASDLYRTLRHSEYAKSKHIETENFTVLDELDTDGKSVVYAGVPGAYAEEAAIKFFGNRVQYKNVKKFDDVVRAVADGEVEYGVIPIENSSAGFVSGNYDIIRSGNVKIVAQVMLDINHCLLGLPDAEISDITKVYSHPQGLMQCKDYIEDNGFQGESVSNTARAAQRVRDDGVKSHAAISSERAAEIYNLKILDKNVNFSDDNSTKFVIITKEEVFLSDAVNVSVCFTTQHKVGALYDVMGIIDKNHLNMTSIESRPSLKRKWEYWFYVTFEGKFTDRNVIKALREMEANTDEMIVLGSY
ncbi:MAG: 2-amino-4-hydroxy-6-hydroxymethyldihydropteridine diphosphokinase [Eubacterium sp.]|nr:2-amino-4-hydroxy-6-hydroxymethyldihydropteridine diphosphokinase [Eubacterium sp.]